MAKEMEKRRNKAGAVRAAERRGTTGRILLRGVALVALMAGLATAFYFGKAFVDQASERPVNSIGVEGHFTYISQEEISALVSPLVVDGFLQVPLERIKQKLESNPWIDQASVSRRWPDQLYISIVEEQPIARWGTEGFLNYRGDIVPVQAPEKLQDLPLLSGNKGQEKSVMQNYQELAQMLSGVGLKINEFYADELLSWNVVLSNGLKINIGRDQTMEKIQRFLVVYQRELRGRMDEVAAVDLRYGNGLAVEWKTATADSAEGTTGWDKKA